MEPHAWLRSLQLRPLGTSQLLPHFQHHRRVRPLYFSTSLNHPIDLSGDGPAVNRFCLEEFRRVLTRKMLGKNSERAVAAEAVGTKVPTIERENRVCVVLLG
jgi:hypothetical protein